MYIHVYYTTYRFLNHADQTDQQNDYKAPKTATPTQLLDTESHTYV